MVNIPFKDPLEKYKQTLSVSSKKKLKSTIRSFDEKYKMRLPIIMLKQFLLDLNLMGFDLKWNQKELTKLSSLKKAQDFYTEYPILIVFDNGETTPSSSSIAIFWSTKNNKYSLKIIN